MFPKETRVLVVDDMRTMRIVVKKALQQLGLENIAEAGDGAEAWDLIEKAATQSKPFQLIVSDWNMPNSTGVDLLKKVRAKRETATTPFVLVTAETEINQVKEAIQLGVNSYITKPFTPATLKEKLESVYQKTKAK